MKKNIFILSLISCLFISCGGKTGPFIIKNISDNDVMVSINNTDYVVIPGKSTYDTDIFYYTPDVKIAKADGISNISSNKYYISHSSFYFTIFENPFISYTIINNLPSSLFDNTGDALFLYEKNNLTAEWKDEALSKIQITADSSEYNISCYSTSPEFILKSVNEENAFYFNDTKIYLKKENDSYIIYCHQ